MSVVETEQAIQSILGDGQVEEEEQMVQQYLDPGQEMVYQTGGDAHQQVREIFSKVE